MLEEVSYLRVVEVQVEVSYPRVVEVQVREAVVEVVKVVGLVVVGWVADIGSMVEPDTERLAGIVLSDTEQPDSIPDTERLAGIVLSDTERLAGIVLSDTA